MPTTSTATATATANVDAGPDDGYDSDDHDGLIGQINANGEDDGDDIWTGESLLHADAADTLAMQILAERLPVLTARANVLPTAAAAAAGQATPTVLSTMPRSPKPTAKSLTIAIFAAYRCHPPNIT